MSIPFSAGSYEDQVQGLSNLFPSDRVFLGKNIEESKLRKLIQGLAFEIWRAEQYVEDISVESNLEKTIRLIEEWEHALGIPDSCFDTSGTLAERRINVIAKLRARGVATKEDFIALALFLGYTIEITTGSDAAYPPYNVPFIPIDLPRGRFIWIITGTNIAPFVPPYDVPFDVNVGSQIIPCFFTKLKPANTILYFFNT